MNQNVNAIIPLLIPASPDAAIMIGITPKTARNWICTGKFPIPTYLIGGKRVVKTADIYKFVENLGAPPADGQPAPPKHRRGSRAVGRPRKVKAE